MTLQKIERRVLRIRGTVQGVGFRPTVFLVAKSLGIVGQILNDSEGVLVVAYAEAKQQDTFIDAILQNCPPLGKIDSIECRTRELVSSEEVSDIPKSFEIGESKAGSARTSVSPDASACLQCCHDSNNPFDRRYRYPFTNCTHCGPRLSIIKQIPYDRANTSMSAFPQCSDCLQEYKDPLNRRFHAQPNACHVCGPKATLMRTDERPFSLEAITQLDDVDGAGNLILNGKIVAIKGIGGFHIACDATNDAAVQLLRERKHRFAKPFALMAKDLDTIKAYCFVSSEEERLLTSVAAPIVLLKIKQAGLISQAVAPGQSLLGFMLPYTPLHHLLLRRIKKPIVLTSCNLSDEPQSIEWAASKDKISCLTDYVLDHNRQIVNRIDDSLVRVVADKPRILRRARGYAPAPIPLPSGLASVQVLAMGAELKNTFCLIKDGKAIISQHMGDLEDALTYKDYQKNLKLYQNLFAANSQIIAIDKHPEYLSSKLGNMLAKEQNLPVCEVQHHHAHIAACLVENGRSLDAPPVLGIALDGLGMGDDGELWGGEFLLADYKQSKRLGTFKPVQLLGGTQAMREPWRNTFSHLMAEIGWNRYLLDYADLELTHFLSKKNLPAFESMLASGIASPKASSCGRLFDAVAAACGVCREQVTYEGQAAVEFEAIACKKELALDDEELIYPFGIPLLKESGIPYIEPVSMWQALLGDLILGTPASVVSARFHKGLARVIVKMANKLAFTGENALFDTVVLTGGVFQNALLFELVSKGLEPNFRVLTHSQVPANDGGISLGQAIIAAVRAQQQYNQ